MSATQGLGGMTASQLTALGAQQMPQKCDPPPGEIEIWCNSIETHLTQLESLKSKVFEKYASAMGTVDLSDVKEQQMDAVSPLGQRLAEFVAKIQKLSDSMRHLIDGCQL